MLPQRWRLGVLALCGVAGCWFVAGPTAAGPAAPATGDRPARELAAVIDRHVAAGWKAAKVEPAAPADDAEFLRRVYLDVAGRIPSVVETRDFLNDRRPDRRARLVDRLLDSPRYVTHFANVWRALWLPETDADQLTRLFVPSFEAWLRKHLKRNAGYDQMVRELLSVPVARDDLLRVFDEGGQPAEPTPIAFYQAKEFKLEEIAAGTSRLFLGVRLECAQCHDHPCAEWKREHFWSYAAFFASIPKLSLRGPGGEAREALDRRELAIPGTERVVQAAFLDGSEPRWKFKVVPRVTLAEWMTAPENPYFARAAVNRLWAHFFGTGLIEPVDDMVGDGHVASHPELLADLARQFAARRFDLKLLIRAITASRAYQLASAGPPGDRTDPSLFARTPVRGLSAEQLFDSLAQATGYQENVPTTPREVARARNTLRAEFLEKFASAGEKSTEFQTSILQALALMNGRLIADATSVARSETLTAVRDAPFLDTERRIETLYLATLSRPPRPEELRRLVRYVESGNADRPARDRALGDVFWALLNSAEFLLNH